MPDSIRVSPAPPATVPAAGGTAAPAAPTTTTVALSAEEYQRLRDAASQLEELRSLKAAEIDAKESERQRVLAEKAELEAALDQNRRNWEQKLNETTSKFTDLERQIFQERRAAVIAQAFAGRSFVGETAERKAETASQVRSLLESRFETVRESSGGLVVRDKITGRPAADVIREALDSPSFAHFFAPTSRGGAGSDGSRSPVHRPAPAPGSLEQIAEEFKARQSRYGAFGLYPS
jgi:hypothetical protein